MQISAERRGIEYIFENDRVFNRQELGGVKLTKQQVEDLNLGKAIFVEDMKRKDGELFSAFVRLDPQSGRPAYIKVSSSSCYLGNYNYMLAPPPLTSWSRWLGLEPRQC